MIAIDRSALRLAVFYLAFGIAWILLSDELVLVMAPDLEIFAEIGRWKGMVFVAVTAFGVYLAAFRPTQAPPADDDEYTERRSVSRHLILIFALLAAVIVLLGLGGLAYIASGQKEREAERLAGIAQFKVDQIGRWLEERRADATVAAADAAFAGSVGADAAADTRLAARLETYRNAGGYRAARLVDENGETVAATAGGDPVAEPESLAGIRSAFAERRTVVTDLYRIPDPPTDRIYLDVIATLPATPGRPARALVLQIDARRAFFPQLQSWPVPSASAETVLFRPDGDHVQFLNDLRHWYDAAFNLRLPLTDEKLLAAQGLRHQGTRGQVLEGVDYRSVPVLGVVMAVPETGWMLLAKLDKDELYAETKRDTVWIAVADVLALLIAAAAVLMIHQRRELHHAGAQRRMQSEKLRALHLLDAIVEGSSDAIFAKDEASRYLLVNRQAAGFLGKPQEEIVGQRDAELFPPAEAERLRQVDADVIARGVSVAYEETLTTADGPRIFHTTKGPLRDGDGNICGVFGLASDVTERKHAEERLRQAAMVFESTRDGVLITNLDERILAVNRAFTEITGFTEAEALGQTPRLLRSNRQTPDFYQAMWSALQSSGAWQGEIWNRRKNGEIFPQWMSVSMVKDADQRPSHYVAVFTDLSQVKRSEAELEHLAHYDPLTDLPNRRLIQSRLEHAVERAHRHVQRVGVLYLDLDRFKTVNDSLGHPAGDFLLSEVARLFQCRLREGDSLGRLGGDEFLVVLENLDELDDAAVVARDLLGVLAAPLRLTSGAEVYVTASIGISVFPDDGDSAMELMRDADAAMYQAKESGRNQFCFYTAGMNAEARGRLELEAALWRAMERNELLLHYQPKVDLLTGAIRGAEALLRWQRNGSEMVPPDQFIPLAEKTGLICSIGNWVIDEACGQIRSWIDSGLTDVHVAVNVSARQFLAGDLDAVVAAALERHGVPPSHLELELTESMLVERPEEAEALLYQLKAQGVELSLDDFGTGYSSFAYLSRFPIDALKIDRSFVRDMENRPDAEMITDAIIGLAHRMHLRVVAEGVETAGQLARLRSLGCNQMQGYYFSRPLPAEEFAAQVSAGRRLPAETLEAGACATEDDDIRPG